VSPGFVILWGKMGKVLAIPDELHDRLQAQAQARGVSIEVYLERLQSEAERALKVQFQDKLRVKGLVVMWPGAIQPLPEFKPIEVRGRSLSQTILEDRR